MSATALNLAAHDERLRGPVVDATATKVEVVRGFDAIREEWRALNGAASNGTMFLGPEWMEPWFAHFGEGRSLQLFTVRENGQLIGLLPLFSETRSYGGVQAKRLAFLGDGATGVDHLDALALPGREAQVLAACLDALFEQEWDVLDLDGLRRDSPTVIALAERFPAHRVTQGCVRDGRLRYVCPHLPLKGTYEELLAGLGRRENLKRREKWLFKQPGVRIDILQKPEDAERALQIFLQLHDARWAAAGGSDGLPDETTRAFHHHAIPALAKAGMLRMYVLYAARRPVACVYGVVHGKTFSYYQSGYEPLWGNKSVGLVLLARTVQDAFAAGLADFDFLRGNEAYKGQWARAERWTVQLRLFRGARGRSARVAEAAQKGVREAAKSAVPEALLDRARAVRRALRGGVKPAQLMRALAEGDSAQCEEGR